MDRSAAFRRVFHLVSPAFLAYYLIPEQVTPNISRPSLVILFVGTAACVEIARIALGIQLFGMRPYEGQRVSAYAQGLLGLVLGIFVVQNPLIVVPVFMGMAWIDPLRSLCRKRHWTVALPVAAYAALFVTMQTVIPGIPSVTARVLYAAVATVVAMAVEGPRIPQVDDDLMMQILPMAAVFVTMAFVPPTGLP